ncbi:MAG: oligosaccharide flippase family protein [Bacteroidota bacterium]|nr:oligosaccharide flippase family protein [Bacteroidota bacterium]
MSTIRKQSILSSGLIYIGFAFGLLNTYFFTKQHLFTEEQYGLTGIFVAIASMMMAFSGMGMSSYIAKFYPYYHDHLPPAKNDMLTWALLINTIGFILVIIAGVVLKHIIIRKFSQNSELLVHYYYWIFALGFGLSIYTTLEVYAWSKGKSVLTNFLREVQWRMLTTILIVLFAANIIKDFDLFIKLYAFTYPAIAIILFTYLAFTKKIYFTFSISKVSRRYFGKIISYSFFIYSSLIIFTVSQVFDSIVIASLSGLGKAGIFALAQLMGSVIQAPQRGIISASLLHLSRAWKEKNMPLIRRIYQRSSINLLIFASGIFVLIALNYKEAILTFRLKETFLLGFNAFILIGLTRIVDMGTGLNSQIIITSTRWRFELISGVILLILILPLTYILTKQYDILGPAIASLVSTTIYNTIRIVFLWKKFRLFPFTIQSAYTILLGALSFGISYFLFSNLHGLPGLILRSLVFIILYGVGVIYLRLSPDVKPVWQTIKKRLKRRKD